MAHRRAILSDAIVVNIAPMVVIVVRVQVMIMHCTWVRVHTSRLVAVLIIHRTKLAVSWLRWRSLLLLELIV